MMATAAASNAAQADGQWLFEALLHRHQLGAEQSYVLLRRKLLRAG